MMKRFVLLAWLLATIFTPELFSQTKEETRNNFYDAESWILYEAYKDALPIYQQLLKGSPNNANYKYRIGQCYMNIPGEKTKAIGYLEDAVKNINPKYKEGKFNETGAPYDALYYLANAYRINNQIDKALKTYERFRKNLNSEVYDTAVVDLQIQSCLNARELMRMPLYLKMKNLGNSINSVSNDFNPVISDKEDLLVFSRSQAFYDALLYSVKVNGVWSEPQNMNELLKVDRDLFPTCISKDGKDLYLYSSADYDGIIYRSRLENGVWSPVVKLNDNINTKYWESHATISHDNKKLYFTSNRKGSLGGLDIYVSSRDSTGDWGPAVNLGPVINTPYNEESPFLSADDKTLFFSSRGHFNMGGYDIFYSTLLDNGEWSVPLNLGYPLNTTDDDLFFRPINQGYEGYIAKEIPGGYGKQDIYRIEIYSNNHPRKFFVRGMVKVADLIGSIKDSVRVSAMNIKNPNQTIIVYSNPKTGEYQFYLPQGNYQITYEGESSEKVIKKIDLPLLNPSDTILLPGTVLPKTDFTADMSVETSRTISVTKGDTIVFPMKVEPNSILTVEHWIGDVMVSSENFNIRDSVFNYKMAPGQGNNRVVFKLTDRFNNTTKTEVLVSRSNKQTEQTIEPPEYTRTIAADQIESYSSLLKSHADDSQLKVIESADIKNKKFGKIDDYITSLKEDAVKQGANPEELDKLALKVAVMNNVLSQSAVDYLSKNTTGDVNKVLSGLNIYDANLKTWSDLQDYLSAKTNGKITPDELNSIAASVLGETDPAILILKKKILAFSETSANGDAIRQSAEAADSGNFKTKGEWLKAFYNEALKHGLSEKQVSEMFVLISSEPGTKADQYLKDLIDHSEEPLTTALKSIDLEKEKIRTPQELLHYLLNNKAKYPEDGVSKSIAGLISSKELTGVNSQPVQGGSNKTLIWLLLIILGAGIVSMIYFIIGRRRRKQK
jgi:hypothetical protein